MSLLSVRRAEGSHMGRSLAGRARTFNPVGSQPSVIPYPTTLVTVSLPAVGPMLFFHEDPKFNLMSFLRLIFSQGRQSQETHPQYLLLKHPGARVRC